MSLGLIQTIGLAVYRAPITQALIRTGAGQRLYGFAYDLYKLHFEARELGALRQFVAPGQWIVDVGANVGFYTCRFARWVRDDGRVIALEPDAENIAALTRRSAADIAAGRVVPRRAVAADRSGTMYLVHNPTNPSDHHLGSTGEPVEAVTLDGLLAAAGDPPVGLIKIDVQGAEPLVLAGASATLARHHPVILVELDPVSLERFGYAAEDVLSPIEAAGYRFQILDGKRWSDPMDARRLLEVIFVAKSYRDVLCVPVEAR